MAAISDRIGILGTENAFKIGDDIKRVQARGMDVVLLNIGEPDFDSIPEINQIAIDNILSNNTHYCDPAGLLSYRKAIAAKIGGSRGLDIEPEQVVVVNGAKPTIGYTMQTYLDAGDEVIYPSPGFPIYESWIEYLGAVPVPIKLQDERDWTFSASDLADLVTDRTKLIMLCSPSNPTGGVLPRELLAGVADVVRTSCRPEVRIYSDEIYEDIVFDGETFHSIASEKDMASRTIISSGMSKGYAMTGYRLGFAVLPTVEEARVFRQLNINVMSCVPPFLQEAGRAALEHPAQKAFTKQMVSAFQERRDWIVPALNAIDGIECRTPKGAFYVFPKVAGACERIGAVAAYERMTDEQKARTTPAGMLQMFILYRYGVATMDRNSFGTVGSRGEHFIRLSIAASLERLQDGVERIGRAVADREGFADFLATEQLWG